MTLQGVEQRAVGWFMPGWLFYRFIVRRCARNPVRILLLLMAVAVATTLVSSVARVSFSSIQTFEDSLGYSPKDYPITISPVGGRIALSEIGRCFARLSSRFDIVAFRREFGEVEGASGRRGVRVTGVTGVGAGDWEGVGTDTINASRTLIAENGLTPGSSVTIRGDSFVLTKPVSELKTQDGIRSNSFMVALPDLGAGISDGVLDGILLRPRAVSENIGALRGAVQEWLGTCSVSSTPLRVDTAKSAVERGDRLLAAYRFNVLIMAAMTVLVCVLLVSQATQVSLRNLSRELAILRTLGVGRWACLWAIVKESFGVGLVGAVLGVSLGSPIILALTELFLSTAHDIYNIELGGAELSWSHVISVVLVMTAVVVTGAFCGALGALTVSPSIGTRTGGASVRPIPQRAALVLALCSLFVMAVVWMAVALKPTLFLSYLYIGACILVVGGVTPFIVTLTPRVARILPGGVSSWIGRGGIRVGARGYLLGAIGATLAIALICALSLMVGSFRETLEVWAKVRLRGDLFVSSALDGKENESRLSQDVVEAVRGISGVERVVPYYEARTTFRGSELVVGASDLLAQSERGIFIVRSGKVDGATLHDGVEVLLSEGGARKLSLRPADSILVEGRTLRIGAIIQEFGTELPLIQIDERLFRQLYPRHNPQSLTIDAKSGASVEAIRHSVEKIVGIRGIVRDNGELRALVLTLFDRTFQVTSSIRWIVFTLGVVGLLLATLQHLWERRRELKTLYLLGMTSWGMVLAFVYEGALVCVLPVGVGVLGGVMMGWGLTHYVNPLSFGWSLAFSFSLYPVFVSCLFVLAVACVVGIATALLLKKTVRGATFSDE